MVAPVSLAAAAGTALVIDRDPASGWPFPVGSLSDLAGSGPSADDLHPSTSGIALLGGPVADAPEVDELVAALGESWPAVVIRSPRHAAAVVRVDPALPWRSPPDIAVDVGFGHTSGAAIPSPPTRLLRRLLRGQIDPRWRWFRHWRPIWERRS